MLPASTQDNSSPVETSQEPDGGWVLIADDDPISLRTLDKLVQRCGYRTRTVSDGIAAVAALTDDLSAALFDLRMPGMDGLDCLRQVGQRFPDLRVMVVSASHEVEDAVAAMKLGAFDYVAKPVDADELSARLRQAAHATRLARENRELRSVVETNLPVEAFVNDSAASLALIDRVKRVAPLPGTVLLTGESGTGKSTIARMIHQCGPRHDGPFIPVNCASIPRDLIETELFGHTKGAFTGALKDRPGRAEIADGGTLFLDEIGDLPLDLQPKLLTFLQDKLVQRIGSNQVRHVDVRLIAATHQDLPQLCQDRRFRQDLFYRLNVLQITIPPLRTRREDIPGLAAQILGRLSRRNGRPGLGMPPLVVERLQGHDWPGNVRELENVLERLVAFGDGDQLELADVDRILCSNMVVGSRETNEDAPCSLAGHSLRELERAAILDTLAACQGNKVAGRSRIRCE